MSLRGASGFRRACRNSPELRFKAWRRGGAAAESRASGLARVGFMVLALGWVAATAMAIRRARQGDLARHRWWMQRSLALTFAAVRLRLIMGPLIASGRTVAETYAITAWGSWPINPAVLEWWRVTALA